MRSQPTVWVMRATRRRSCAAATSLCSSLATAAASARRVRCRWGAAGEQDSAGSLAVANRVALVLAAGLGWPHWPQNGSRPHSVAAVGAELRVGLPAVATEPEALAIRLPAAAAHLGRRRRRCGRPHTATSTGRLGAARPGAASRRRLLGAPWLSARAAAVGACAKMLEYHQEKRGDGDERDHDAIRATQGSARRAEQLVHDSEVLGVVLVVVGLHAHARIVVVAGVVEPRPAHGVGIWDVGMFRVLALDRGAALIIIPKPRALGVGVGNGCLVKSRK